MSVPRPLKEMSATEIKAALANDAGNPTETQLSAIEDFIDEIGGIENALLAVELLSDLEEAA
jgi:hypothetical protein